jgi:hypothetical protein
LNNAVFPLSSSASILALKTSTVTQNCIINNIFEHDQITPRWRRSSIGAKDRWDNTVEINGVVKLLRVRLWTAFGFAPKNYNQSDKWKLWS